MRSAVGGIEKIETQRATKKSRRQGLTSAGFQKLVAPAPHLERYVQGVYMTRLLFKSKIIFILIVLFSASYSYSGQFEKKGNYSINLDGWIRNSI